MKRTKEQYLDLLRYYFRKAKSEDLQEILSDHEEHFLSGCEQGLRGEGMGEARKVRSFRASRVFCVQLLRQMSSSRASC